MAGSTYGTLFRITTWGESHGPAIGVVIDGCPSGLSLSEEDIQKQLDRRKPDRVNLQRREMKATLSRFSPVFSRVRQPAHQSLSLSTIRTSVPEITVKLKTVTVPDMLIIHLMQNMASAITAVADVLLPVKQLPGRSRCNCKKILEQLGNRPDCLYPFYWRYLYS